ncbi:MAG: radical SAM protein [Nannocystaceae bacterium]
MLVVHPPLSVARDFIDYPQMSDLGAVQLAAVLAADADVTLVDAFALPGAGLRWRDDGRARLGVEPHEVIAAARGEHALAVVAITPFHRPPLRDDLLAQTLAGLRAAAPTRPIVLADLYQSGQHYVAAAAEAILAAYPEVDAYLAHEAELGVPQLLAALRAGEAPRGGLRGRRPESLDALPLPAWDRVDLRARDGFLAAFVAGFGRGEGAFPIRGRTLPWISARGCPYDCAHCSSNPDRVAGEPKTQRRLAPATMRAQLAALRAMGAQCIHVLDEMVNVHPQHLGALLDAAEAAALRLEFPNGMRADHLDDATLVRLPGRITTLSVSAESGSQRVLDEVVGKRLRRDAIERVAASAHRLGLPTLVHFIIGMPGERASEINETLAFALSLFDRFDARPAVQFATPLPGTRLARASRLPLVDDWGPRFQTEPTPLHGAVDAATLQRFKTTFEARLRSSTGPQKLILNATYVCNNHCTFCAVGTRTQLDGDPTRQREVLAAHRRRGVELLDIDGGEPTMNPELFALIRYARALGYRRINVTTNGRLCAYPEFAARLVGSGVTSLLFSLHGVDARTHAAQVGVAEAFDQTVAGIRNCVAAAPPGLELGMNTTVTKGNHAQLPELAALCLSLGLRWFNIQFLTPFGRATRMVAPDTETAARLAMQVIDRFGDRMNIQVINLPFCFMPGYERHLAGDLDKRARQMVFVNNDGVNLAEYLAARRVRKPVCDGCPHACFCAGFYELDDVPEPPWQVRAEDLRRPVAP